MKVFTMTQVHEVVKHAGPEGLWTSHGTQEIGEMMVGCPKGETGRHMTDLRDLSVRRMAGSEDHAVVAHTELGAIFLDMLARGEL